MIDLRKTPELPPPVKNLSTSDATEELHVPDAMLQWNAPEYEAVVYTRRWFMGAGGVALVLAIIAIMTRNYFFLAFVALSSFVVVMFAKREPREFKFAIAKEGVYIGRKVLAWAGIKSFWIFEKIDRSELSLETDKALTPLIRIPLRGVAVKDVRETMKKFVPEKEQKELIADEIGRNLGL